MGSPIKGNPSTGTGKAHIIHAPATGRYEKIVSVGAIGEGIVAIQKGWQFLSGFLRSNTNTMRDHQPSEPQENSPTVMADNHPDDDL